MGMQPAWTTHPYCLFSFVYKPPLETYITHVMHGGIKRGIIRFVERGFRIYMDSSMDIIVIHVVSSGYAKVYGILSVVWMSRAIFKT